MNPLQTHSNVVPAHNKAAFLPYPAETPLQVKERSPGNTPTNLLTKHQRQLFPFLLGPDHEIDMIYAADVNTPESNQLYRNRILSRFRKQAQK